MLAKKQIGAQSDTRKPMVITDPPQAEAPTDAPAPYTHDLLADALGHRDHLEAEIKRLNIELADAEQQVTVETERAAAQGHDTAMATAIREFTPVRKRLAALSREYRALTIEFGDSDSRGYGTGDSNAPLRDFARTIASGGQPATRDALQQCYRQAGPLMGRIGAEWRLVDKALKALDRVPQGSREDLPRRLAAARRVIEAAAHCDPAATRKGCVDLIAEVARLKTSGATARIIRVKLLGKN